MRLVSRGYRGTSTLSDKVTAPVIGARMVEKANKLSKNEEDDDDYDEEYDDSDEGKLSGQICQKFGVFDNHRTRNWFIVPRYRKTNVLRCPDCTLVKKTRNLATVSVKDYLLLLHKAHQDCRTW